MTYRGIPEVSDVEDEYRKDLKEWCANKDRHCDACVSTWCEFHPQFDIDPVKTIN